MPKLLTWKEDYCRRLWSHVYTQTVGLYFTSDDGADTCEKMSEYVNGGNPESHVDDAFVGLSPSCSLRHSDPYEIRLRMNCAFFFFLKKQI